MAAYTQGRLLAEIPVSNAMSKTVVACRQDDTIATAEQRMQEHRVRRLAVVDGDGRIAESFRSATSRVAPATNGRAARNG
jgi:CBS domain-containing protein